MKVLPRLERELLKHWYKPYLAISKYQVSSQAATVQKCSSDLRLPEQIRSSHDEPSEQDISDIGRFYTIPPADFSRLSPKPGPGNGFSWRFLEDTKAFNECSIMIRRPALEIINYLKHSDFTKPVQRYLVYGDKGTGKSITLQHVTHYCIKEGWLVLPTMYAWAWNTYRARFKLNQREEVLESQWKDGRFDQPLRATWWLEMFRDMNKELLPSLSTTKEYIWTKREKTPAGQSFDNLVDLGIARPRISTDIVGSIMREIRCQPPESRPRTLITVDCLEAVFSKTWLRKKIGSSDRLLPDQLTFYHNLKKTLSNTWSNGAVVVATSSKFTTEHDKSSAIREGHLVYDNIGHDGFDILDPHIPVEVPNYSHDEALAQIAYYKDRKWLLDKALTNDGLQEIIQMSCNNPSDLELVCGGFC